MVLNVRITFREYLRLLFALTYRRPVLILIVCVGIAMLGWIVGYHTGLLPVPEPLIYQYLTFLIIGVAQPLVIYSTIWKNYYSSNHLRETVSMELDPTHIRMRGSSFYTELSWEKIYKVQELKSWFLIYQNNLSAIMVPKKSMTSAQQDSFRQMLRAMHGIPMDLLER